MIGSALGLDYQASDDGTTLVYKSKIDFVDEEELDHRDPRSRVTNARERAAHITYRPRETH
jgi:hypothetical protein